MKQLYLQFKSLSFKSLISYLGVEDKVFGRADILTVVHGAAVLVVELLNCAVQDFAPRFIQGVFVNR